MLRIDYALFRFKFDKLDINNNSGWRLRLILIEMQNFIGTTYRWVVWLLKYDSSISLMSSTLFVSSILRVTLLHSKHATGIAAAISGSKTRIKTILI